MKIINAVEKYDYENRIVEITKVQDTIAKYFCGTLGRRIRKYDARTESGTLYYYSNPDKHREQILEERIQS